MVADDKTRGSILASLKNVFGEGNVGGDIAIDPNAGPAPGSVSWTRHWTKLKIPGRRGAVRGQLHQHRRTVAEGRSRRIKASLQSIFGTGFTVGALPNDASSGSGRPRTRRWRQCPGEAGLHRGDLVSALNLSIINFDTGSAAISAESRDLLTKAAPLVKQLPAGTVIEIGGHTDSTGDPAANLALSQQRAEAVRITLIDLGVPADMLKAKGYGDTQPVASNDTAEGRLQNRRISYAVVQ